MERKQSGIRAYSQKAVDDRLVGTNTDVKHKAGKGNALNSANPTQTQKTKLTPNGYNGQKPEK